MAKRSLVLAGGGLKVAFQAGVLQVWLDEAGLTFDHADGASGGVFNLAMYCQGQSGTQIAENWRNFPILSTICLNWRQLLQLFWAEALLSYDKFRRVVLHGRWNLDWSTIRSSGRQATFNAYDFSRHELRVRTQNEMDEDFLVACVSLPGWFPPVRIGRSQLIDGVYVTDANLIETVERGADELWIIWTVSRRGIWNGGFINTYFQVIEAAANGNLKRDLDRIEANNEAFALGERSEFDREIKVHMLQAEVRLHYLINFSSRKFTAAVEQGAAEGRAWCAERGLLPRVIAGGRFDPRIAPVKVHNEIEIQATAERIWSVLVCAAEWPNWYPNSARVRIEGGFTDLYPDARFSWITFNVCIRSVVQEFRPFERVAWSGTGIGIDAYHAWLIVPTVNGCRVLTEETQYGWLARAQNFLLPRRMCDSHQLWLQRLARRCAAP